jgi:hypothetical protein
LLETCDFVSPPDVVGVTAAFFNGKIELDPASSEWANTVVSAERILKDTDDGLSQTWRASSVYLYPPRGVLTSSEQPVDRRLFGSRRRFKKSAQRIWIEEAVHKYKKQEFDEAIIFLTSSDVALLSMQKIGIDLPMCIMKERPELYIDSKELPKVASPRCYGFIYYIPAPLNTERRIGDFINMYSVLGRVFV